MIVSAKPRIVKATGKAAKAHETKTAPESQKKIKDYAGDHV